MLQVELGIIFCLAMPLVNVPWDFLGMEASQRKRSSTCRTVAGGLEMNMLAV
jgi:hypothetical protein